MSKHVNMGGFDLLGSGRMKLSSEAHFAAAAATVTDLALDGLLVIGGDDSCTNAAYLAEAFAENDVECAVVGVPKTIDDDMRGGGVEACFGFDSASKGKFCTLVPIRPRRRGERRSLRTFPGASLRSSLAFNPRPRRLSTPLTPLNSTPTFACMERPKVFSEIIGNVCSDARSARKYWHFVRVMGRSASHLTLECALQCQPNLAFIGEEIEANGQSLSDVADEIADVVAARAASGYVGSFVTRHTIRL